MKIELHPSITHARRALRGAPMIIRRRGETTDLYDKPQLPPSNTGEQLAVRAAWRAGIQAWNALSPETKSRWSAAARETDTRFPRLSAEPLNGYQLFQACAKYRQILDLPLLTEPGGFTVPAELTAVELLPSASAPPDDHTYRLRILHNMRGHESYRLIVSLTPPTVSSGRKPDRRNARHIKGYGIQSTVELPPSGGVVEFTDARYAVTSDQRFGIWIRVVHISSATAGPEFFHDAYRPAPPGNANLPIGF